MSSLQLRLHALPLVPRKSVIPGFGITMGFTLAYLGVLVLLPFLALALKAAELSLADIWAIASVPRAVASYKLSFGASAVAAGLNMVFGLLTAWVLVRYEFPGKRLIDSLVDLPFALPTAVAGIALTGIYATNGWVGQYFEPFGIRIAYSQIGIVIALTFIGLPFVVRSVQPLLADFEPELEEAAATLGAGRLQTLRKVVVPAILPALLTGVAMAFARAVGEFGSIIFIAGNIPFQTEITPLLIFIQLEQHNAAAASVLAGVMLLFAFFMLLVINGLQLWANARGRKS
jgi:sulfate transport system permease protein